MIALGRASLVAACCMAAAASAQLAPAAPAASAQREDLRQVCATLAAQAADAQGLARRAECVLAGLVPSASRFEEARTLARSALAQGEPAGGLLLYLAFRNDPANQFLHEGRFDPQAYRRLAARPLTERREQIEAIEGLGVAAGRNNPLAGLLLATYFHDTLAPGNVTRLGALTGLLARNGERGELLQRYTRDADAIEREAHGTRASVRAFVTAYGQAVATAQRGFREQTHGRSCEGVKLKTVSAGDLEGAEFLPLKGTLVADSYLLHGHWNEFWTFAACGEDVPVKVTFEADGWGGSNSTATYNKGA